MQWDDLILFEQIASVAVRVYIASDYQEHFGIIAMAHISKAAYKAKLEGRETQAALDQKLHDVSRNIQYHRGQKMNNILVQIGGEGGSDDCPSAPSLFGPQDDQAVLIELLQKEDVFREFKEFEEQERREAAKVKAKQKSLNLEMQQLMNDDWAEMCCGEGLNADEHCEECGNPNYLGCCSHCM